MKQKFWSALGYKTEEELDVDSRSKFLNILYKIKDNFLPNIEQYYTIIINYDYECDTCGQTIRKDMYSQHLFLIHQCFECKACEALVKINNDNFLQLLAHILTCKAVKVELIDTIKNEKLLEIQKQRDEKKRIILRDIEERCKSRSEIISVKSQAKPVFSIGIAEVIVERGETNFILIVEHLEDWIAGIGKLQTYSHFFSSKYQKVLFIFNDDDKIEKYMIKEIHAICETNGIILTNDLYSLIEKFHL